MKKVLKDKLNILIIFISIFLILLCFNRSLWGDEAWTAIIMKYDFKEMIREIGQDVHPPLYFVLLKLIVTLFDQHIEIMKIMSVIPTIILMAIGKKYIKHIFKSDFIAGVFICLVGLMPSCMHMSVELRMYSWSILFVTWSAFLGCEIYLHDQRKDKLLFTLSGILAAYTHNFNIISEIFVYMILFIALLVKDKKYIKDILIISLITILGYLPWLFISFKQVMNVNNDFWLWSVNFTDVAQMLIYPFNSLCHNEIPNLFVLIFIGLPLLMTSLLFIVVLKTTINNHFKNQKANFVLLCYIPMYGLMMFGIVYGLLIRPIFVARYLHSTIGIFFLGLAVGISFIKKNSLKNVAIIILICNMIYGCFFNIQREYFNGTEDTLAFFEKAKKEYSTRTIVTDIFLLSTTVMPYYETQYTTYSNTVYSLEQSNQPIFYIADQKNDQSFLENMNAKKLYSGNIDNEYFFDIYLINNVEFS